MRRFYCCGLVSLGLLVGGCAGPEPPSTGAAVTRPILAGAGASPRPEASSERQAGVRSEWGKPRTKVLETKQLHIDKLYPSMTGPASRVGLDVSDMDWVTSFKSEVIDLTSGKPLGDEFFCHSQLQMWNSTRLMVTATGSDEIRFPPGYAMPFTQILSGVPPQERVMSMFGMVLNNHEETIDAHVTVRGTLEYYRKSDLPPERSFKQLYKAGLTLHVEDIEEYVPEQRSEHYDDVTTHCVIVGDNTSHWIVPPGPQLTRKRYRNFLAVDATVHYAKVHLHNYGVYLRFTNVTTGEVLWQTDVEYEKERKQIARIPEYSSVQGFPIYADHEYEIEAFYDNTTDRDVDAMAQIDLYYYPGPGVFITYPSGPS